MAAARGGHVGCRRAVEPDGAQARRTGAWRVRDDGPGVPPELRDKIFTPFFTTREKGTGLGLAFVREIVADHGGEVTLRDAPGGGSIFSFDLPAAGRPRASASPNVPAKGARREREDPGADRPRDAGTRPGPRAPGVAGAAGGDARTISSARRSTA